MCGAILNALNYRLDAASLAFILDHAGAKVLLTDRSFSPAIADALSQAQVTPLVIDIDDTPEEGGDLIREVEYEVLLADGDPDYDWPWPEDEWDAISLNYTSGTTGNPKGVLYHHRGAYLNSLGDGITWAMPHGPVYLWSPAHVHTATAGASRGQSAPTRGHMCVCAGSRPGLSFRQSRSTRSRISAGRPSSSTFSTTRAPTSALPSTIRSR